MRADARENHDRLLEVATDALERDGADASLKAIAADAGVGIGTLYRRFPTRDALVWAVYRSEVERICASVAGLLAAHRAVDALRAWMESFVDFLAAKQGMADALRAALTSDEVQRLETRALLTDALTALLEAGIEERSIRPVAALDVLMALGGTSMITAGPDQEHQAGRLLDLLMHGLVAGP